MMRLRNKKISHRLVMTIAIGVFLYASYSLFDIVLDYYQNRKVLSDIQESFYESVHANEHEEYIDLEYHYNEENDTDDNLKKDHQNKQESVVQPQFKDLLEQNEDVAGWITIEDTQIDYPILQAEDNEKYLNTNFSLEESRAGSIFLDYRNDIQFEEDRNIVIYGHRMKDGSMFQHLTKFLDEDFFKEHKTFEFETLYGSYEAEVFAVYQTLTDFNYIQTHFEDDASFKNLLEDIQSYSLYDSDVEVTSDDQIITLSTCDYLLDPEEGRLAVHAKVVEK